jgi:glucose/arabinose dehydrogenase/mono/diheme cytochrome c family protein
MIVPDMRRLFPFALVVFAASCRPATPPATQPTPVPSAAPSTPPTAAPTSTTAPTNERLFLPGGFASTVFHDGVGRARHLAVTADGIVYVKLRGQVQGQPPAGFKGVVALRDTGGDGRADQVEHFGAYEDVGDYGTAMRVYEGHIYFTTAGEVYRQKLVPGQLVPDTPVELVLKHNYRQPGRSYEHIAKPITFDDQGHLYVPFGAPGDVCQDRNRQPGAPGAMPCGQLEWHSGVWQFDARRLNQTEKDGRRYATGIRSLVAMTWNPAARDLYAVQHGRDDLYRSWPQYFSRWQSAILPSEEFFRVTKDFDGGWPYYYFDWMLGKKLLNPEYGGDGKKEGDGAKLTPPLVGFPGHFAPNDLLFYQGRQFPERYRNGAFIAFHGSTIRMPYSQGGYFVGFVPMKDGKPSGEWEVFADGIAGIDPIPNTGDALGRPMGLAEGPDGSLYISDSVKGRIWKVTYRGKRDGFGKGQLAAMATRKRQQMHIRQPDEQKDVLGGEIYAAGGKLYQTYCAACHQGNGMGDGQRFPPLGPRSWAPGNKQRLISVVLFGLSGEIQVDGKGYNDVMPANGFLSDEQVSQILTYIRQNFGNLEQGVSTAEVADRRARGPWTPPAAPVAPAPTTPPPPPR